MDMRGAIAVVGMVVLAVLPGACIGAEDDCAGDADCPAGSSCVKNGDHKVCMAGEGGSGGGGSGGAGGTGGGGSGGAGGTGGACPDDDGDGVCDDVDNCPDVANPDQANLDGDSLGDACDACPNDLTNDEDDDGVCGDLDNCPHDANPDQEDLDEDGLGDACDPDVDEDGVLNPDDCAPRDRTVYPGADDPCDGKDADCEPNRCALDLEPEAGWAVRDITCAPTTRLCAVALRNGADGRVVVLGIEGTPETLGTMAANGVLGVSIDPRHGTGPVIWTATQTRLVGSFVDGSVGYELAPESPTLSGEMAMSPFANIGVAAHDRASAIQFFSPKGIESSGNSTSPITCDVDNDVCKSIDMQDLFGATTAILGMRKPSRIAIRHKSNGVPAQVYSAFHDDERLAVSSVGYDGSLHGSFSGLLDLGLQASAMLAMNEVGSALFVVDTSGDGAVVTPTNDASMHTWEPFALSACPAAILALSSDLLVASRCDGEPAKLITLSVTDGMPDEDAAVTTPLPNCTPTRMAGSPQLGADGPDAALIGCEGTATVLVLGRD